jgi:hypothetical protein
MNARGISDSQIQDARRDNERSDDYYQGFRHGQQSKSAYKAGFSAGLEFAAVIADQCDLQELQSNRIIAARIRKGSAEG